MISMRKIALRSSRLSVVALGAILGGWALLSPFSAQAYERHHGPYFLFGIGGPYWGDPYWPYGPRYPYYPYYPYYEPSAPAVTVIQPAPVLITPPAAAPPAPAAISSAPAAQASYYYCAKPKGYYPYVKTCQIPWQEVPVQPPQ